MEMLVRILAILSLISLSCAKKPSVNVLTPSSGLSAFKEEDILDMLSRNKTATKNFTFVKLINNFGNNTIDSEKIIWSDDSPEAHHINPHYGESRILYFCVKQYNAFTLII